MITDAIVAFYDAQPVLLDQVPQLGHVPKIFQSMSHSNNVIPKSAVKIVHQLSASTVCIRAFTEIQCVGSMKKAMTIRPDIIGLACEALMKMFEEGEENLVEQVSLVFT